MDEIYINHLSTLVMNIQMNNSLKVLKLNFAILPQDRS